MTREHLQKLTKGAFILSGAVCLTAAALYIAPERIDVGLLALVVFATLIGPRMSIALPRTRFALSFSDAAVFLAFLFYGGPAAVWVAALEMLASCTYLRSKGVPMSRLTIAANISINSVALGFAYLIWRSLPTSLFATAEPGTTQYLLTTLGSIAILHFLVSSILAAIFRATNDGSNPWHTWRRECFSSSLTQIVGAALAGIVYKVINFGDIATGAIAFLAMTIAYLGYRQSINKLSEAMHQAEEAEREKAEAERERRREAEKHAGELSEMLHKEELANEALRKSEKDLQHSALHDSLTGLPNRKHFGDILRVLIAEYKDDPRKTFQVLFIDIQKFKHINDSLGHTLGDKVLMVAAKRFVRMLNADDMVARIGGDEFAIILKDLATVGKAQKVARRIRDHISQPFSLSGNRITINVNIGIAPCDAEYNTPQEVLRDADIAMHYAKEKDIGTAVFTKELRVRFLERVRFENDLRNAIERDELSLSYQPVVNLQDGSLLGFEALLRWHHSELGQVPPNKFIPVAEESGLIIPMTKWILDTACTQLARWQKINRSYRSLMVSVNISGKHLSIDELVDDVEDAIAIAGIKPSTLKLEITESAAMENAEQTISVLNRLKALGVQLSIDDFGTGYSSLSYLHRLPFDTLKIDRSFVYSVGESGENSEILQTIISLAKNLRKKVIAEGIETRSQLSLLQNLGCDYGQGYLLARPQDKDTAERSLYQKKNWLPAEADAEVRAETAVEEHLPVF